MANHTNHDQAQLADARDASIRARRAKAQVREALALFEAGWSLTPPSSFRVTQAETRQYDVFREAVLKAQSAQLEL